MKIILLSTTLGCLTLLTACQPVTTPTEIERADIKTLSVTGVGEVEVMPDLFVLSGAIIQQSENSREAMNALADIVNDIQARAGETEALTSQEFSFASVNTTGVKDPECLLFNQEADRTNSTLREGEKRIIKRVCQDISQQASISFTFTAGPPNEAGDMLADFSEAGAIRLTLDGYKINNIEEIELQAGERAVANAREKADRLAAAGGATITGVVDLNSYQSTYNQRTARPPVINTSGAGESSQLVDGGAPVDVTSINLEAGMQVVSAAVQLEFIYE
ncbi:SIMPL domain-containing protein [Litorimonas sp. WD9-15]|uniref:SIMPL domain-containing protein n=1 Tax=Litorimonas sp. WD9-15 TaxID=3418716 RepID=UPI003CFD9BF4